MSVENFKTIEFEEVKRLKIHPGEILIIKAAKDKKKQVSDFFHNAFPEIRVGVHCGEIDEMIIVNQRDYDSVINRAKENAVIYGESFIKMDYDSDNGRVEISNVPSEETH